MLDRVLGWVGDPPGEVARSKLDALRLLLLAGVAVEISLTNWVDAFDGHLPGSLLASALVLAALLAWYRPLQRPATIVAAGAMLGTVLWRLPFTPNHYLISATCLLLLATLDVSRESEARLCLQGLRWIIVIVFFVSGVQKLSYGTYFRGEFLLYDIAVNPEFAAPFELLFPDGEIERLRGLGGKIAGAGPYRSDWLPMILVSNFVYVFEMIAPLLLFSRRTRAFAVAASLLFTLAIEVGAREIFFGAIAANLLLLFTDRNWNRLLLPGFLALYALLVILGLLLGDASPFFT